MSENTNHQQQTDELPVSLRTTTEVWQTFLRALTEHVKKFEKS
jgi:hypothetical protein